MFYVYVLENEATHQFYTGSTDDLARRLDEHIHGKSMFTRHRGFWKLVYSESFETRSLAVRRELEIKSKKSRTYIERLIARHCKSGD
ncbi:MAG: GIY-YIG nuclease family protein [Bacteroidetes bacterium]|nr:GIY-YIG nuclease family protein [Nitrososphaerota archaeon]MCL5267678.1 GIY-YIG nuclease family protein [Bacteroidota bacterium]